MSASEEEPMKVKIKLEVYVHDEFVDEIPDFAYVDIDEAFIDRILHLRDVLKEHNIDQISNYDYSPTFMANETDENYDIIGEKEYEDFRAECLMLNITEHIISWSFLIKNTSINGDVDSISIEMLEKMKETMTMPVDNLPTLINDEDPYIKDIVKERLKNG